MGKAPDRDAVVTLTRFLAQIVEEEIPANLAFLERLGGDAETAAGHGTMLPVTYAYTRHLLAVSVLGDCAEGLTAVLPCQWSYGELARPLTADPPGDPIYADWIAHVRQRRLRRTRRADDGPARSPRRSDRRAPDGDAHADLRTIDTVRSGLLGHGVRGYEPPVPPRTEEGRRCERFGVHGDLSLRVDEIDDVEPGPGEVLVRTHAAGVCGTDLHILDGMIKPDPYPMTLGHEAAGLVEDVGEGVSLAAGTPVAIYNKIFCGRCEQCLKGRTNICDNEPDQLGFNRDGGDAEYVVVPEQNAVPVPDGVDLATASVLTCAGMTAIHATRLSGLRLGDTAMVDGIGGVGISSCKRPRTPALA